MKTYIKILLIIGAVAVVGCISMGLAFSMAVGEIEGLRLQITELQDDLEDCQNGYFQKLELRTMPAYPNSNDRAMLEVIKKFAELQSANITIDTPTTHIHIEWER